MVKEIKINTESIQLDQFLKWSNLVGSGGEAKKLIQAGEVMVNEEVNYSRGTKLIPGDVVEIKGDEKQYQVSRD